jgi:hypothetical protein
MKNLHTTLACCALLLSMTACKTQNKNEALRSYSVLSTLEHQLSKSYNRSDVALEYLKKDVKRSGKPREGIEAIKRAERLKKKVAYLVGEIDKVKRLLIDKAGDGLNAKTHYPKQALDVSNTQSIMRKEAPQLSNQIETYVKWLDAEYKDLGLPIFPPLHKGPEGQNFYETFFAGAHLGEVLIMLTNKQSQIMRYHAEVMKKLSGF